MVKKIGSRILQQKRCRENFKGIIGEDPCYKLEGVSLLRVELLNASLCGGYR
jgi:hypothetical protein